MGFRNLRKRLEDLSFCILEPDEYQRLVAAVAPIQSADHECLQLLKDGTRRLLVRNGLEADVTTRRKGLYSIHRKMQHTGRPLESILDTLGLRVVVESVADCYAVLGLLHSHFRPIPGTFTDYIARPKPNGYQSLHACVLTIHDTSSKPVEFQIRTRQMHQEAEFGLAAHWRYKQGDTADQTQAHQQQWFEKVSGAFRTLNPL